MKSVIIGCIVISLLLLVGCVPKTFIRGQASGWKTIELNDATKADYNVAWKKTVDTIAKTYDIEMMDKESGYLRTGWTYGISGGAYNRYRGRLTIKYPEVDVKNLEKIEIKTEAQWLVDIYTGTWQPGWDSMFQRDAYNALSGRLGRTVSND